MASLNLIEILRRRSGIEWIIFFALLTGSAALGNALSSGTSWIDARAAIYGFLTTFGRAQRVPQRTAIVLLDDTDYWTQTTTDPETPQLAGRAPTNRAYLASLIDNLSNAHVGLIVLDFDLRSPTPNLSSADLPAYNAEDALLFKAITDACTHGHQVVLASELLAGTGGVTQARNIYDNTKFPNDCLHTGYIELPTDIRRVPVAVPVSPDTDADSLSLAAVRAVDLNAYNTNAGMGERDFPYSQFLPLTAFQSSGPAQTLFSGRQIETLDPVTLRPLLLDRIVLIGSDWHTLAFGQGPYADRHATPAGQLPGVVLHANYIEATLQHGINQAFPEWVALSLEALLVLGLSTLGMLEIHWAWKWGAVLLSSFVVIAFSYFLLRSFGLMLDFFFPLIFVGLHSGYEHVREWRQSHVAVKE